MGEWFKVLQTAGKVDADFGGKDPEKVANRLTAPPEPIAEAANSFLKCQKPAEEPEQQPADSEDVWRYLPKTDFKTPNVATLKLLNVENLTKKLWNTDRQVRTWIRPITR
jgi:hypothetical protein